MWWNSKLQLTKWQSPESWGAEDEDDGPVQFDELAAQYKKGVVHLETYVWHKLLGNKWVKLKDNGYEFLRVTAQKFQRRVA